MRWTAAKGRNTPTGVGKTVVMVIGERAAGKHPHRRGEDDDADALALTFTETPPQAWGRQGAPVLVDHRLRNTPTGVGKTPHRTRHRPPHRKHPHGRREDSMKRSTNAWCMETPPQAWGRPSARARSADRAGNTPTGVGKTAWSWSTPTPCRKHPHRSGEDLARARTTAETTETPPQAWGRLIRSGVVDPYRGNTPTGVGKTQANAAGGRRSRKHPHRRGEDAVEMATAAAQGETPPQAWGRLDTDRTKKTKDGNTPTGVGKTHRFPVSQRPHRKHPHRRGEDAVEMATAAAQGETPPQAWGRLGQNVALSYRYGNTLTGVGKTIRLL